MYCSHDVVAIFFRRVSWPNLVTWPDLGPKILQNVCYKCHFKVRKFQLPVSSCLAMALETPGGDFWSPFPPTIIGISLGHAAASHRSLPLPSPAFWSNKLESTELRSAGSMSLLNRTQFTPPPPQLLPLLIHSVLSFPYLSSGRGFMHNAFHQSVIFSSTFQP